MLILKEKQIAKFIICFRNHKPLDLWKSKQNEIWKKLKKVRFLKKVRIFGENDIKEGQWWKWCVFSSPAAENADVIGPVAEDGALVDGVEGVDDLLQVCKVRQCWYMLVAVSYYVYR